EQLVHRPVSAGEDDEAFGVLHEHRLADEEVLEVDRRADPAVHALLEGQLDVAADALASRLGGTAVCRFHDAGTTTGDHAEAVTNQEFCRALRCDVVGLVGAGACTAEDADGWTEPCERVEPLHELAHDSEDAPRV